MPTPLAAPFPQYEGGEVCGVCGHVIVVEPADKHDDVIPTTIIPGFLYLGNYDSASRSELLKAMNISHILNVGRASDRPRAARAAWRRRTTRPPPPRSRCPRARRSTATPSRTTT
jgi:hypothetical protein